MKHLEDLPDLEKDVIRTLRAKKQRSLTIDDLRHELAITAGLTPPKAEVNNALGELIEYGSVRSYLKRLGKGQDERRYYLSRALGSGSRNQATLYGHANLFRDFTKYIQRIFGSIFISFGLGVILYGGLTSTGNVIRSQVPILDIGFILSFMLAIIGALLLISHEK